MEYCADIRMVVVAGKIPLTKYTVIKKKNTYYRCTILIMKDLYIDKNADRILKCY